MHAFLKDMWIQVAAFKNLRQQDVFNWDLSRKASGRVALWLLWRHQGEPHTNSVSWISSPDLGGCYLVWFCSRSWKLQMDEDVASFEFWGLVQPRLLTHCIAESGFSSCSISQVLPSQTCAITVFNCASSFSSEDLRQGSSAWIIPYLTCSL